jgi:hypothetical protein
MSGSTLFAAALVGLIALFLWQRKDFVVRARPGRFECRGLLPVVQQKALAQFLLHELPLRGEIKILGKKTGGRLRLWFRGPLTPGEQQRIRNFLFAKR